MTAPANPIYRDQNTVIQARQARDGKLVFLAVDVLSGAAVLPLPSRDECASVMPFGWELYPVGTAWRARPLTM
jgi:hypothetical protein